MTYYRCATCNRPILSREFTDYDKQCKKCGTPVAKPVTTPTAYVKDKDGYRKVESGINGREYVKKVIDSIKPKSCADRNKDGGKTHEEEELSLKEVQALVRKMENETYKAQELLGKIHDKMIMLMAELKK